ncbi:hypothetical protein H9P43_000783 [Blastocladiella emersonii ATCC 22665]|nr:hypothetical protein H9P43_000783 [Blastocladiella emersonii ATCC 22665]
MSMHPRPLPKPPPPPPPPLRPTFAPDTPSKLRRTMMRNYRRDTKRYYAMYPDAPRRGSPCHGRRRQPPPTLPRELFPPRPNLAGCSAATRRTRMRKWYRKVARWCGTRKRSPYPVPRDLFDVGTRVDATPDERIASLVARRARMCENPDQSHLMLRKSVGDQDGPARLAPRPGEPTGPDPALGIGQGRYATVVVPLDQLLADDVAEEGGVEKLRVGIATLLQIHAEGELVLSMHLGELVRRGIPINAGLSQDHFYHIYMGVSCIRSENDDETEIVPTKITSDDILNVSLARYHEKVRKTDLPVPSRKKLSVALHLMSRERWTSIVTAANLRLLDGRAAMAVQIRARWTRAYKLVLAHAAESGEPVPEPTTAYFLNLDLAQFADELDQRCSRAGTLSTATIEAMDRAVWQLMANVGAYLYDENSSDKEKPLALLDSYICAIDHLKSTYHLSASFLRPSLIPLAESFDRFIRLNLHALTNILKLSWSEFKGTKGLAKDPAVLKRLWDAKVKAAEKLIKPKYIYSYDHATNSFTNLFSGAMFVDRETAHLVMYRGGMLPSNSGAAGSAAVSRARTLQERARELRQANRPPPTRIRVPAGNLILAADPGGTKMETCLVMTPEKALELKHITEHSIDATQHAASAGATAADMAAAVDAQAVSRSSVGYVVSTRGGVLGDFKFVDWTPGAWHQYAGGRLAQQLKKKWLDKNGLDEAYRLLKESAASDHNRSTVPIEVRSQNMKVLLAAALCPQVGWLRRTKIDMRNRLLDLFAVALRGITVLFGHWYQSGMLRLKSKGPVKEFRDEMKRRGVDIHIVDEAYTSKRCAACWSAQRGVNGDSLAKDGAFDLKNREYEEDGVIKKEHRAVYCRTCKRHYNRDRNGAANIFFKTLHLLDFDQAVAPAPHDDDDGMDLDLDLSDFDMDDFDMDDDFD